MRRIVVIACIAAAFPPGTASAQTLYKCASRMGNSYQQAPCAASSRTLESMDIAPEPPPSADQLAQRQRKAEQDRAESAFLSHLAGTDQMPASYRPTRYARMPRVARSTTRSDDCRLAKAARKTTLESVGLNRTYDLLRRLDEQVSKACGRD